MKTTHYPPGASRMAMGLFLGVFGFTFLVQAQEPLVTVRFANPSYECLTNTYCLDVEFLADQEDVEVFGMNIRFFYDDDVLELIGFSDFQGGYGPFSPDPPTVFTNGPAGPALFNFVGPAEFVNGAMQLVDPDADPILLSTTEWTKLFQICFIVEDNPGANPQVFCPSVVWDLEADPTNGGFLVGDDGVVITVVDPDPNVESSPADENVVQFNWAYDPMGGGPPYGMPVEEVCISIDCSPMLECAADITIECSSSTDPDVTGMATATDICPGEPIITYSDITVSDGCPNNYTITREWIATNDCDLNDTCIQIIQVIDTVPPAIACPPMLTVSCASQVPPANPDDVTVSDNCPGDIDVVHAGDMISNQTCANRYTITRTYIATDGCGNSSSCTQVIVVNDIIPPMITCPANVTVSCIGQVPGININSVTTSDNCEGIVTVIHVSDQVSGMTCTNRLTVTRTYRATDVCGNSATCAQIITVFDQTPPSITCPAAITVSCASEVPVPNPAEVTRSDNCGGTVTVVHSGDVVSNQTCANRYTITRTYTATDVCGNTASCTQVIVVNDQTPPNITCPANITVSCADDVPLPDPGSITASDNCGGFVSVTHIGDTPSGQMCANQLTIFRSYQATDVCGNSTVCVQTIVVRDDTAPTIVCPTDITVSCTEEVPAPDVNLVSATDNCPGDVTISFDPDVILGQGCAHSYRIIRTYIAEDVCGNTATCQQIISVMDVVAPELICPPSLTVSCADEVPDAEVDDVTTEDNCSGLVTVVHEGDVITGQTCDHRFTLIRTYRAFDACGNSASCQQIITVFDQTPPETICPDDLMFACANDVPSANPMDVTILDNCPGDVTISHQGDVISGQTCLNQYTILRTYLSIDDCGNSATCTQTIVVNDAIPPQIMCPDDLTLESGSDTEPPATGTATATDNCTNADVLVSYEDITLSGSCVESYYIERTWIAMDVCGNSATCIQIIYVDAECYIDLALTKNRDAGQDVVMAGDDIHFTITVTNEGNLPVGEIHIIDYIPLGFSLNDPDWVAGTDGSTGQSASIIISIGNGDLPAMGLLPGESVSVGITLQADPNILPGIYENIAEILAVFDVEGNDVTDQDVDSTPDNDDTNDPPTEDDHDAAAICVLEVPGILGDLRVCPGDVITYMVENYNPQFTYTFSLINGGGMIIETAPSYVVIQWGNMPGGPFTLQLVITDGPGCTISGSIEVIIEGGEPIACIDHINLSINDVCGTQILSGLILTGDLAGDNSYQVFIIDMNGDTVPNATFTWEHVGQTFKVSVVSVCTGQSCWGWVTVEDKLPPVINCVCPVGNTDENCIITCLQVDQFLAGDIPVELRPNVVDNCGGSELEIIDIMLHFSPCVNGYIEVTWKATDLSGNMSTCKQQFNIVPLTLDAVRPPADYVGDCTESADPDNTGWPLLNGLPFTDEVYYCNLFIGYTDQVVPLCGQGRKIIRLWKLIDWCTSTTREFVQTIYLDDREGPVLTCPNNITVGTDVWYCHANVVVQKPAAFDLCSPITQYQLTSPNGTVVVPGSSYTIQGLPIGTHLVTWIVKDACHNTSTCSFEITVIDNVPPVVVCDLHTVVSLSSERPNGVTLVSADSFSDGSSDNCGPVFYRARRMDSCIDFNWTTGGACVDEFPGGFPPVDGYDAGTEFGICVPFGCCDIGRTDIMVQVEVRDAAGNVNYCMVQVEVQDKLAPTLTCPPQIIISCEFPLEVQPGLYRDIDGNGDGSLDEDPLSALFGNIYDAFRHQPGQRGQIILHDPDNPNVSSPHNWGLEGWATDNCDIDLSVLVVVMDDCSGAGLPAQAPAGAVKLIERRFMGTDGVKVGSCMQRIWVVDFDRFYISDVNCDNEDPADGVIWPCDVLITSCPESVEGTGEPIIFDDGCSLIGVTYKDTRYDFAEGACYKILREWKVLDWCQFNAATGAGLWTYTQTIKVADGDGAEFVDAPLGPVSYCVDDPGISLPDNNQILLGEGIPGSSSCSVHVNLGVRVRDMCSEAVTYDVRIYPFNGLAYLQMKSSTQVSLDANHEAVISFDTRQSQIPDVQLNGLPYNSSACNDYHRILWSVEDGCGNRSVADYLFRLEDCKAPSPVCYEGLSTMIMGPDGSVTVWASDFNASSFDDCTPGQQLVFSFSGDTYQPSFTYTCENVPAFGQEIPVQIWAADGGTDHNCNGQIEWDERNADFCTTTIVITDEHNVCENQGGILEGEISTEFADAVSPVTVRLTGQSNMVMESVTSQDGHFSFAHVPLGASYRIAPERNDQHRNGVSTLDLVRIQKHLLGKELFTSPYQYIAADANSSGSVSAIDLVEIRKVILGLQETFTQNTSWRFVRKGSEMAPGHPWPFEEYIDIDHLQENNGWAKDFVGVKIGDVNNTVQANATMIVPRSADRILNVRVSSHGKMEPGEFVTIDLEFPERVSGFQWTMETEGLEFAGIMQNEFGLGEQHMGVHPEGVLTMSWHDAAMDPDINSGAGMTVSLQFRVTATSRLIHMIGLSDKITMTEAYTRDGEVMDVRLTFNSSSVFTDFALYQNKPNPWNHQTVIGFHLPEDAPATLTIYDVHGAVVKSVSGQYKAGYNSVTLAKHDIPASGVLYYRLDSGSYTASKKMIVVE